MQCWHKQLYSLSKLEKKLCFLQKRMVILQPGLQVLVSTSGSFWWAGCRSVMMGKNYLSLTDYPNLFQSIFFGKYLAFFLLFRVFGLLSSSLLLYSQRFGRYVLRPSSGDSEVPVMLELWGMWSTSSLPSLPGRLWPGVVAPDRVLSMGQIELVHI